MTCVYSIVEGDGEVEALPVLLRRLSQWLTPEQHWEVLRPTRVRKDRFLNREEEFDRHLKLASFNCGESGWILILLDADDDCPKERSEEIGIRARQILGHARVAVVMANREFEAWFIAANASLEGVRGFRSDIRDHDCDAERPRNAKGWIQERIQSGSYKEVLDQPAFAARMDLELAHRRSRSFRKLCSEWRKNCRDA